MPPPAALIVMGNVPGTAVAATARVRVDVPEPGAAMDAGLKLGVTPAGWPVADRETAELKP